MFGKLVEYKIKRNTLYNINVFIISYSHFNALIIHLYTFTHCRQYHIY